MTDVARDLFNHTYDDPDARYECESGIDICPRHTRISEAVALLDAVERARSLLRRLADGSSWYPDIQTMTLRNVEVVAGIGGILATEDEYKALGALAGLAALGDKP